MPRIDRIYTAFDQNDGHTYQCFSLCINCSSITTSSNKIPSYHSTALPTAPTDVQISEVTATSVRLEWSYKGPEDLQYYVIQYKPKNANQAFSEISGIITMYYVVRALSPYTEYEFYVIAVNNIGRGPPSAPATCTTGETSEYRG